MKRRFLKYAIISTLFSFIMVISIIVTCNIFGYINIATNSIKLYSFVTVILCMSLLYINRTLFTFNGVYFFYFSLSVTGAMIADFFFENALGDFRYSQLYWVRSPGMPYALSLSMIAIISYTTWTLIISRISLNRFKKHNKTFEFTNSDNRLWITGTILLLYTVLYFLYNLTIGSLSLNMNYGEFRNVMDELPGYSLVLFLLSTGISFSTATGNKKQLKITSIIFILIMLFMLITGNRGEIFYPLAAVLPILIIRGLRVKVKIVLTLCLIVFLVIPIVGNIRNVDKDELSIEDFQFKLYDPIVEIGYQLRPFVETVTWIDSGEDFAYGKSYLLPVQRIISRVIPFYPKPELENNRVNVKDRTPSQGYSVIAEAYFNFGFYGMIFIPLLIVLLLRFMADGARDLKSLAFAGAVFAILINNIRNSFIFVPGQVIYTILIFLTAIIIPHLLNKYKNQSN